MEQCWENVWSHDSWQKNRASADLVNLTLYFESLCPDSRGLLSI